MMNNGQKSKEHIFLYDWIRVIGTFLVVIGHSVYMEWQGDMGSIAINMENVASNFATWRTGLGYIVSFAYMFHMPLFFSLSGGVYAIGNRQEDLGTLVKKKFIRLIVPYYLGGILWMFPLRYISGFYPDIPSVIKAFIRFAVAQYAMGHLWFLPALFMCFILFWIIRNISANKGGYVQALVICFIITFHLSGLNVVSGFGFPNCLSYIIYFAIGYGLELFRKNVKQYLPAHVGVFLVTSGLLYSQLQGRALIEDAFTLALVGIFWTYSFSTLICRVKFMNNKVIRRLSVDSFIVYILHEPINFIMLGFGEKLISTKGGTVLFFGMRSWLNIIICLIMAESIHFVMGLYRKRKISYGE